MKKRKAISFLIVALCLCALVGTVWLVAAGYAETAMETMIRWGEDGTLTAFEAVVMDRVIPMLAGFGTSSLGLYLASRKMFKAIEKAKGKMDDATGEAVKTYETHNSMNQQLETFMENERKAAEAQRQAMKDEFAAIRKAAEAQRQAMKDEFAAMMSEQRASLAADRASMKRIEGKVDGIRRAEVAAFGATGELVKKGTATQIAHIIEDTEGTEVSSEQEGGEEHETAGTDGKAAEDQKTA